MPSRIDAEAAGGLGPGTEYDPSLPQPLVGTLRYEFQGWLGDELVTTSGYWLVTDALAATLTASGLSGYELADVIVTKDEQYDLMPHAHELRRTSRTRRRRPGSPASSRTGDCSASPSTSTDTSEDTRPMHDPTP